MFSRKKAPDKKPEPCKVAVYSKGIDEVGNSFLARADQVANGIHGCEKLEHSVVRKTEDVCSVPGDVQAWRRRQKPQLEGVAEAVGCLQI